MDRRGFTFVEVLVVMAIISILASIVLVAVNTVRDNARLAAVITYAESLHHILGVHCEAGWDFERVSGSTVPDVCGGNYDGSLNGAVSSADGINKGSALQFDGVDDYMDMGVIDAVLDVEGENGLTLAAWFKADAWTNGGYHDGRIIDKSSNVWDDTIYWMLSTIAVGSETRLRFRLKTDGVTGVLIANEGALELNRWYFAVASFNGSTMDLYLNGELVGSMAKTGTISTNGALPVYIGNNSTLQRPWSGLLDDVRIYERAVKAAQVQRWYVRAMF